MVQNNNDQSRYYRHLLDFRMHMVVPHMHQHKCGIRRSSLYGGIVVSVNGTQRYNDDKCMTKIIFQSGEY